MSDPILRAAVIHADPATRARLERLLRELPAEVTLHASAGELDGRLDGYDLVVAGPRGAAALTRMLVRRGGEAALDVPLEEVLAEVEGLFAQFTSAVEEIIGITTADGLRNLYVSPAYEAITGRPRGPIMADPRSYLEVVHPDDRGVLHQAYDHRERPYEYQYRILRPDGEIRWLHCRAFPIRGEDGRLERIATLTRDVTRDKEVEHRLLEQQRLLDGVTRALTRLLTSEAPEGGVTPALRLLAESVDVDRAYVARHDRHPDGSRSIAIVHEWTREEHADRFAWRQGDELDLPEAAMGLLSALESGGLLSIRRSEMSETLRAALAGGMQSLLMVPVRQGGACWGHVGFVDAGTERPWASNLRSVLEMTAAAIGAAMARQRTMLELEEQLGRMSALYAGVADPTIPLEAQIQRALSAVSRLLGMEVAGVIRLPEPGEELAELRWVHPEDNSEGPGARVYFDRAIFEESVRTDRPAGVLDFVGSPFEDHPIPRLGYRSFLGFPLWVGGKVWGGLALLSRAPRPRPFRQADDDILRLVARGVGLTIEQREAEQERAVLEARFRETQKLESLGVLAGGIAHDFNNLLMGIMGNASVAVLELPEGAGAREHIDQVLVAARRASDLTRQMLAYAGKGRFTISLLSLEAMVQEMIELLATVIPADAQLSTTFADALPAVRGDRAQLQQVIMNLITNAADALPEGVGRIRLTTGTERFEGPPSGRFVAEDAKPGRYVFVEVSDTGVGMDEAVLSRIFDPFFTTKFTGRGLGLAAVLGIVRSHRGALRVESRRGKGTTIRVLFPAADEPARAEVGPPGEPVRRLAARVLVADDVQQVRDTVRTILERHGVEVVTAGDGEQALRTFERERHRLDAAILDLTMPRHDGGRVHALIRERHPSLPVVIMSGYAEEEVLRRLAIDPHTRFLQKPFGAGDLLKALATALRR